MRKLLLSLLMGLCLIPLATATSAHAAGDCVPKSWRQYNTEAHVVAYGTVQAGAGPGQYQLLNELIFKGSPANPLPFVASATEPSFPVEVGKAYTLYLVRDPELQGYTISPCSGSHEGAPSDEEMRVIGKGRPAIAPGKDPKRHAKETAGPARYAIPFAAIGVTVGVVLFVLRSRKKG